MSSQMTEVRNRYCSAVGPLGSTGCHFQGRGKQNLMMTPCRVLMVIRPYWRRGKEKVLGGHMRHRQVFTASVSFQRGFYLNQSDFLDDVIFLNRFFKNANCDLNQFDCRLVG